jgi:hypothetical protein
MGILPGHCRRQGVRHGGSGKTCPLCFHGSAAGRAGSAAGIRQAAGHKNGRQAAKHSGRHGGKAAGQHGSGRAGGRGQAAGENGSAAGVRQAKRVDFVILSPIETGQKPTPGA